MIKNENYYSSENAVQYMSASQYKMFAECEEKALAEIRGDYKREAGTALLVGSYVDAWFEGTLETFKENHPEILLKNGGLKADFVQAESIIERVSEDAEFMKYMSGEKQKIFTGNIAGVSFRGKLDSYHKNKCIVDLKVMKDFEPIWKNGRKMSFVEAWGYDIQGAIYQELVYQATGKKLPFVICAVTKEKIPDLVIISIPQNRLDLCLEMVKSNAPHYQNLKLKKVQAVRCEKCDYCKMTKKITGVIDYRDLNPELFKNIYADTSNISTENISVADVPVLTGDIKDIIKSNKPKKRKKDKKHKKNRKIIIKL